MKIAVIAANGRTGRIFVNVALAAGYSVRAGIRSGASFAPTPGLEVVHCDATNQADVEALIEGQDAVVSFIGHVKDSAPRVQTEAMKVIVEAMRQKNIRRIVSLTGTGVRFPGDTITIIDRILNKAVGLIDPDRVKDGIEHAEVLKSGDLDWTILRVLKLENTKPQPFELKAHGPTKLFVSRRDVALAALEVIVQARFIKQAPILGSK